MPPTNPQRFDFQQCRKQSIDYRHNTKFRGAERSCIVGASLAEIAYLSPQPDERESAGHELTQKLHMESCLLKSRANLRLRVTAAMPRTFIEVAPQRLMRGDGQDEFSAWRESLMQRTQGFSFFRDMFQHVEHADKFKLLPEGIVPNIALYKRTRGSFLRKSQSVKPEFQAHHGSIRAGLAKGSKYVSGSAPNFKHEIAWVQFGRKTSCELKDQAISRAEPKMTVLGQGQFLK